LFEPGCPVPLVVEGCGLAAEAAPTVGTTSKAPMITEVAMCFMPTLLFTNDLGMLPLETMSQSGTAIRRTTATRYQAASAATVPQAA
jgi:hypothetical protein